MSTILTKFKNILLGVDDDYEDDDYDEYEDYEEDDYEQKRGARATSPIRPVTREYGSSRGYSSSSSISSSRGSASSGLQNTGRISSTVTALHNKSHVHVHMPKNIESARDIIENTRANVISVVNLEGVDSNTAQRIADFLSGSVDALDATIRRLSFDMFIIAPFGVEITGELQADINEELKGRGLSAMSFLNFK